MKISEHVLISGIEIDLHSNFVLRLKPLNLNYATFKRVTLPNYLSIDETEMKQDYIL